MGLTRRGFLTATAGAAACLLSACGRPAPQTPPDEAAGAPSVDVHAFDALTLPVDGWSWDEEHDVYYQLGLVYCLSPASSTYQRLSVFVPGPYFSAEAAGDTYRCEVNPDGSVGPYDASGAPVVMPVDCASFGGQVPAAAYSYEGLKPYLDAGCVYVLAGCRGRTTGFESRGGSQGGDGTFPGGMPWDVCDLKCAVRYLRYNGGALPGGAHSVFAVGAGAGGGLVAALGATGDAPGFDPYLKEAGAAAWGPDGSDLSDALTGAAVWNPPVSMGTLDSAYEWLLGRHVADGSRDPSLWTSALSRDLAGSFGTYLSGLGLTDGQDAPLALAETPDGEAADGSYYQAVLSVLESSAGRFFDTTAFPATLAATREGTSGFPGAQPPAADSSEELAAGAAQNAAAAAEAGVDLGDPSTPGASQAEASRTFETAHDYLAFLNGDGDPWISYSPSRSAVRIGSLGPYVRACCAPELPCTAYDGVGCDTPENQLFGVPDASTLHFSVQVWELLNHGQWRYRELQGWKHTYPGDWAQNLTVRDDQGLTPPERSSLCDPMAYLSGAGEHFGAGAVAPAWRVNCGLAQSRVPFTESLDLAWALGAYDGVSSVELNPVWGGGFDLCEAEGDPVSNVLAWVARSTPHPSDASRVEG